MAELFRKDALETMANPEQLDQQIKIVRPAVWLMGSILVIGFLTFILWSFLYTISNGVNMEGVMFTNNGVRQMKAVRSCVVTDVLVSEGEQVEIGDILAVLSNEERMEQIQQEKKHLEELEENSPEYEKCKEQLEGLTEKYMAETVVKSTASGQVSGIAGSGNALMPGDIVASVIQDTGYHEVLAFVPIQTAQNLSVGLTTQVSPSYAPREEYGYMTGTITEISDIPVTKEKILAKMGTLSYVEDILPQSACVEVHIKLDLDSRAKNQYRWSNEKGESLSVELGTQCFILAVTEEYRPIELLLQKG